VPNAMSCKLLSVQVARNVRDREREREAEKIAILAGTVTKQEKLHYLLLVNKVLEAKQIFMLAKCVSG